MSNPGPAPTPTPDSSGAPRDARRERDSLLARLPEFAPIGVFITDRTGLPLYVNPRMADIAGRDAAWMLGNEWPLSIHPDDRERVLATMAEFMDGEEPRFRQEYRICRPDGGERRVVAEIARVRAADGATEGFTGTMEDVTERLALELRAREAQKMEAVGRLAGGIAHDFNNLLTVIRTYTEFLATDLPDGDPRRADAHQVLAATERAAALTRQLLAFGRRRPAAAATLDLARAVRELRPVLARTVGPGIRVELTLGDEPAPAHIDPAHLEQVLLNLAANAREAMPDGGTLTVATRRAAITRADIVHHALHSTVPVGTEEPGDYVVLALRDEGRGMDEATQARMFEPLFTTKPPGAGVGLGLATVWGIVTQANGHLRVESAPGAGTTVELWLPAVAAPRRRSGAIATPLPAAVPTDATILVVEDEPAVRTSVRRILERVGYRVLEARHGLDARLQWESRRGQIALVLTDLEMPEVDGVQLASALRSVSPDVRFLFMSGHAGDGGGTVRGLGPRDLVLEKPFEARTLLQRVREALEADDA